MTLRFTLNGRAVEAEPADAELVVDGIARGRAVQKGADEDLFERPAHTFVGHFIGSPGMNFLPVRCAADGRSLRLEAHALSLPFELRFRND